MAAIVDVIIKGQYNAGQVFKALDGDLGSAMRATSSFSTSAAGHFKSMLGGLADVKAGFDMVMGAAQQVGNAVNGFITFADQVEDMGRVTGASAEEASVLIAVTNQLGISADKVTTAFEKAIKNGINPSIDEVGRLAEQYNSIKNPIEQTRFLLETFGQSGAEMADLLELGQDGIRELGEEAEKTGKKITEAQLIMAQQAKESMNTFEQTWGGFTQQLTVTFLPAITAGLSGVSTTAQDLFANLSEPPENFFDFLRNTTQHLNIWKLAFDTGYNSMDAFYNNMMAGKKAMSEFEQDTKKAREELERFSSTSSTVVPIMPHSNVPKGGYQSGQGPAYPYSDSNPTGYRANFGTVVGGMPYMVGEKGPEIYTPSGSGYIGPVSAGGSGSTTMNNSFNFYGSPQENAVAIEKKIREMKRNGQI